MRVPTKCVYMIQKNVHGAWVIYGIDGVRQYYGYSKMEALALYRAECAKKYVYNEP